MLIVTANCKNTFDSYLKYVHYTDSKRRKTRFSGATGWLLLACAAAVIVSFVKVGGNIFLYVVSAVLVLCAAAYLYIQYLAPYRAFKKLDKSFLAEQEFDFYEDKLELIENGEKVGIDLTENDLVFITNGGCVENSSMGSQDKPAPYNT